MEKLEYGKKGFKKQSARLPFKTQSLGLFCEQTCHLALVLKHSSEPTRPWHGTHGGLARQHPALQQDGNLFWETHSVLALQHVEEHCWG